MRADGGAQRCRGAVRDSWTRAHRNRPSPHTRNTVAVSAPDLVKVNHPGDQAGYFWPMRADSTPRRGAVRDLGRARATTPPSPHTRTQAVLLHTLKLRSTNLV
jgi:hypothetical protein